MPLFGTGHARFSFDRALIAIAALRDSITSVEQVIIVVYDRSMDDAARRIRLFFPSNHLARLHMKKPSRSACGRRSGVVAVVSC